MKRRAVAFGNASLVLCVLLLIWQGAVTALHIPKFMLPAPMSVAAAVVDRASSLSQSFLITATAAGGGLAASILAGTGIALVFAQSRWLRRMLLPYTILLQTVPIVAIAPLILMWIGPGTFAVTVVTFIICLAPIIASTTQGLISVDENLLNLMRMQNATAGQMLLKLRLPHALPSFFTGLRIAGGISVIGAITGELFAGSSAVGQGGLGYSINYALSQLQTDYLFALVFAATVLGFSFFFVITFLEYQLLHNWHESARRTEL